MYGVTLQCILEADECVCSPVLVKSDLGTCANFALFEPNSDVCIAATETILIEHEALVGICRNRIAPVSVVHQSTIVISGKQIGSINGLCNLRKLVKIDFQFFLSNRNGQIGCSHFIAQILG